MENKKVKACFNTSVKSITLSLGWWETQPRNPAQVSMEQGEFGFPVSRSLPLAGFAACVLHYRQARPTPGKSRVWEQRSVPRDMPLSYWAALVAGISTGSAAFPNMGYTRASFMGFCHFKYHQYYHLLNVSLSRPLMAGSRQALCSAPLLAPGQAPSRHSLLCAPYQELTLCPKCFFLF